MTTIFPVTCHYCGLTAHHRIVRTSCDKRPVCNFCLQFHEGAKRIAKGKRIEEINHD